MKHLEMNSENAMRHLKESKAFAGRDTREDRLDTYSAWTRDLTDDWSNIESEELIEQLSKLGIWR